MTRRGIRLLACSVAVLVAANLLAPRAVAGDVDGAAPSVTVERSPAPTIPVMGLYGF